ncbi:MAG: hypothetical protein ABI681_07195 [Gemmatimonadales bacterium]
MLAAVLVWSGRHFVNPDGISYLDLSDDFAQGRWGNALNAHWSPAYPFLLSQWLQLVSPPRFWEATAVHVLNGLLFLISLATFEFFLRELRRSQDAAAGGTDGTEWAMDLHSPAGMLCACSLFLWSAFVLITVKVVAPDMMLAAIGFAIAGLLVRAERGDAHIGSFIALGVVLGVAYLAKSLMFPVSVLILTMSMVISRKRRHSSRLHAAAAVAFAIVALSQVVALSRQNQGFTFSESGRIAYALKVSRYPKLWTGTPAGSGAPSHPIRMLDGKPATYLFASDSPDRSYPVWDDPALWYRGMKVRFDGAKQLSAVRRNLGIDLGISLKILLPLLVVWLLRDRRIRVRHKILVVTSALVIITYLFLHSEARLLGFWLVLGTVSLLAGVRVASSAQSGRVAKAMVNVMTVIAAISLVRYAIDQVFVSRPEQGLRSGHLQWEVARRIEMAGIPAGSRVALVGDESDSYWARLARVQIAVQIPLSGAKQYWDMTPASRADLNRRIADAGVVAIVASWSAPSQPLSGWIPVEGTQFSFIPLQSRHESQPDH